MRAVLIAVCLAAALAACERRPEQSQAAPAAVQAPAPDYPYERVQAITWDDAAGGFAFEGQLLAAGRLWRFDDGPQGFYGQGAAVSFSPLAGTRVTNTVHDALIRTPDGLALDGSRFNLLLIRLGREADGPPWDGSVHWITEAHGEHDDFHAKPFMGAAPALNETVILAYDMAHPVRGGADWVTSMIRQIRLDTDDGAGGRFILRQMALVENPAPARLRPLAAAASASAAGLR